MEQAYFPREVTGHVPLITLTGSEEIRVEQHLGLVAYTPEQVVLKTASGLLTITGHGFHFSRYSAEEALLKGEIVSIAWIGREEGGTR